MGPQPPAGEQVAGLLLRDPDLKSVLERRRTAGSGPAAAISTLFGVSLSQHCPGRRRDPTWGPWPSSERSIGPETPSTPCSTRSSPSTWRSSCAWVSPNDRAGVERLCRYVLRPPLAQERLGMRGDGRVALELKRVWHDGTRELVFEPLEFLERLAAMTPRPETNLLICHGVLAPRARWRARVVVYGRRVPEPTASTAPLAAGLDGTGVKTASPRAWSWAALMHRAFGIDVLACAQCGGRLRLIATLYDPAVIRKILAHLALAHSGQSPGPAPPESGAAAP